MLALCAGEYIPGNVDRMYAAMWEDITNGTRVAPDFNDALELHRLIDRIEQAAL
jgi:predicted dehydrogenase